MIRVEPWSLFAGCREPGGVLGDQSPPVSIPSGIEFRRFRPVNAALGMKPSPKDLRAASHRSPGSSGLLSSLGDNPIIEILIHEEPDCQQLV